MPIKKPFSWHMVFFLLTIFFSLFHLYGELPHSFSLKPTKNYREVYLEYPEDHPFGVIKMEDGDEFTYYYYTDLSGNLVAFGKSDAEFNRDTVEVYDHFSHLIGTIIRSGRALSKSSYTILDANNHEVATGSMNLLGTRLYFCTSEDQRDVALFYRPFFQLIGDYWYTKVGDHKGIDERLLVFVGAVQSTLITKSDSILGI